MKRNIYFLLAIAAIFLVITISAYAELIFFDDFEYSVGRTDSNASELFIQNGGWNNVKTMQSSGRGANGHLYTVASIPGFSGQFPGINSSRALVIEALPETYQGQTDFYLQLGSGDVEDYIPGDVWFQFWAYPQYYGNQLSRHRTDDKFFYPSNTSYPSHSHKWIFTWGCNPMQPNPDDFGMLGNPSSGQFYWLNRESAGVSRIVYSPGLPYNPSNIGPQNRSEWMKPNRWTLVKIHFNTTSTSGNSWEVWLRPQGAAEWTKVSEWIGGRTPNFTWTIPAGSEGGHRTLRMPTTVGGTTREWYDSWLYMDDFAMANSERDLPTYEDGGLRPQPPRNLRIE